MSKKDENAITVVLCDDHPVVREGIAAMVNQQRDMQVVAQGVDGAEALALWKKHQPDVVLLDLKMGKHDGVEAVRAIRALDASARILILTTYEGEEEVFQAMRAGANAYLLKDTPRRDLLDAIRRLHQGETIVASRAASKLAAYVSKERLTARELEVLRAVARGKANKEIADALVISESTVKAHLKALFTKLGVLSRTEAVNVAVRRGLFEF